MPFDYGDAERQQQLNTIGKLNTALASLDSVVSDLADILAELQGVLSVDVQKQALIGATPATAAPSVTASTVVASNSARAGLIISNVGSEIAYLAIGDTAEVGKGFALFPNTTWSMDEYTFSQEAISAITVTGTTTLAIQELT